jgi:5'-3' exonuclease
MGVPKLFQYLKDHYGDILWKELDKKIAREFLDLNCVAHPCAHEEAKETRYNPKNRLAYERKINVRILEYIKNIVDHSNPTELLFIAIDGVAPRAKMNQQRYRRFKSIKEKADKNAIHEEYDPDYEKGLSWDTNAISPGTEFMFNLSKFLKHELVEFYKDNDKYTFDIIFSDASCVGEGEHKIFHYIRENPNATDGYDVIYGLDADLIMLSLTCGKDNMALLRERVEFGNEVQINKETDLPELLYLHIDTFRNGFAEHLRTTYMDDDIAAKSDRNFVVDYVFICFLLGNDFLPHALSLNIAHGGIDKILDAYMECYESLENHIILIREDGTFEINQVFFVNMIASLAEKEDNILVQVTKKRKRFHLRDGGKTPLDIKLNELHFYPYFHREKDDYVDLGSVGWRDRYYKTAFDFYDPSDKNKICKNYLEGLLWTNKYYFEGCMSYKWYYRYRHPPSLIDLRDYLRDPKNKIDINKCLSKDLTKYKPYEQLLLILPNASKHLLPKQYASLMTDFASPIIMNYPVEYEVDTFNHKYYWECVPILPDMHDSDLLDAVKDITITKEEKERNKLTTDITLVDKH